jgi:hypothetical protein
MPVEAEVSVLDEPLAPMALPLLEPVVPVEPEVPLLIVEPLPVVPLPVVPLLMVEPLPVVPVPVVALPLVPEAEEPPAGVPVAPIGVLWLLC